MGEFPTFAEPKNQPLGGYDVAVLEGVAPDQLLARQDTEVLLDGLGVADEQRGDIHYAGRAAVQQQRSQHTEGFLDGAEQC